jgi:rhamnosyltransferase
MSETVAIIMRACNEMPHVRSALGRLRRQTFSGYALFAVDSGSTDGTFQALEEQECNLVRISPETYVPGNVLNDAIERTTQPIIVLLNADAVPCSDDWLEKLLLPIHGNRADATFSRQVARPNAKFIVAYDYARAYNPAKVAPGFFSAVACAFRRELWEQHRFREHGYAEDTAWAAECLAGGARVQLAADSVVEHSHNYTLKELYRKRHRQALTFKEDPNLGRQSLACLREIARDLLYAVGKLKIQTIPYNMAYRITIHRAVYRGLKSK